MIGRTPQPRIIGQVPLVNWVHFTLVADEQQPMPSDPDAEKLPEPQNDQDQ